MTLVLNQQSAPNPVNVRVAWSPLFEIVVAFWGSIVEHETIESFVSYDGITSIIEQAALSEADGAWMAEDKGAKWVIAIQLVDQSGALAPQEFADYLKTLAPDQIIEAMEAAHSSCDEDTCQHPDMGGVDGRGLVDRMAGIFEGIAANE